MFEKEMSFFEKQGIPGYSLITPGANKHIAKPTPNIAAKIK